MAKEPINLLEATPTEFKAFLDSFDHVFSDCDGVIWAPYKKPLPGAEEFFEHMKKLGKTVHYVSNNSLRTRKEYDALFNTINDSKGFEKLTIPSLAIVDYLKSVDFKKQIYCVACAETINVLEANGFKCKQGPEICPDSYSQFDKFLEDDEDIGAVVIDSDFKVNLAKIYRAVTYLKRTDVLFINGATDRYLAFKPGVLSLGTGAFTDLVVDEARRTPIQLGKPGKMFGELAMKRAGVTDRSRVLFIGDMIDQDVGLGKATGFHTLLVLTSTTKEEVLSHKDIVPDYYADSLGSIVPLLAK